MVDISPEWLEKADILSIGTVYADAITVVKFRTITDAKTEQFNADLLNHFGAGVLPHVISSISQDTRAVLQIDDDEEHVAISSKRIHGKDMFDLGKDDMEKAVAQARARLLIPAVIAGVDDLHKFNAMFSEDRVELIDMGYSNLKDGNVIKEFELHTQPKSRSIFNDEDNPGPEHDLDLYAQQCDDIIGILKTGKLPETVAHYHENTGDLLLRNAETLKAYLAEKRSLKT